MPTTSISARAADPGNSSRAFPWPVLEVGNYSFPNGVYTVTCTDKDAGKSIELRHEVQGAALIERWLDSGKLDFICTVASPRSMYRMLHKSSTPEHDIAWQQQELGEYPMFTPMIVARESIQHVAEADADGLNQIWDGRNLVLPKGARIAVGPTFRFKSGISGLLDFNLDADLSLGRFRIQPSHEDGFKFKVHLAIDLYQHLRHRRNELAGKNVMVHIVSAALSMLKREYYQDDEETGEGWQSHRNLIGLADLLEQQGLGHWSEDNFQPEFAATGLYPHVIPTEEI